MPRGQQLPGPWDSTAPLGLQRNPNSGIKHLLFSVSYSKAFQISLLGKATDKNPADLQGYSRAQGVKSEFPFKEKAVDTVSHCSWQAVPKRH